MTHPWDTKWQITENLATGGQGVTKKVSQLDNAGLTGVLKYLKNNKNPQARARMNREVNNLRLLPSLGGLVPNVLDHNTNEFENISTELFVVMNYIEGPTLAEYVKTHGPLSIDESIKIVMSICQTVAVAHEADILHRDLKPDNIILHHGKIDEAYIIDYGLSFNLTNEDITETNETFRNKFLDLPETNTTTANHRDPRSDLTAICAIFYFCLTGFNVGQLQDANGHLAHNRAGHKIQEVQQNDNRVEGIEILLTKGFSVVLANRFQSVSELMVQLKVLYNNEANDEINQFDPVQIAKQKSRILRTKNRKIILKEFEEPASALLNHIQKEHKTNYSSGQLDLFELGRSNMPSMKELTIANKDIVKRDNYWYQMQAKLHEPIVVRNYLVASVEDQCVLIAADASLEKQIPGVFKFESFDEIAWYTGDSTPVFELVAADFRNWIIKAINDLSDMIERLSN
ncbi:Serine/threonine-protein kinase PrkC [Gimesia maris]|uniref:serine/threonine protein kinase n=1 Tax=Gimesia maris TaxID=122 RepID=UPI00118BC7C7|nr:protein kinase [Gimesia maris]QDU16903.1 Serine/threonine-protein kinase PrkC [Gimesia maris]